MVFSHYAHHPTRAGVKQKLMFIDVKKAYFNAIPSRAIFVRVPRELGLPKGTVGRLIRCCYGTRDAGMLWEETYSSILTDACFIRGQSVALCVLPSPAPCDSGLSRG